MQSIDQAAMGDIRREALDELAPFRATMSDDAYERAAERATVKVLRDRLRLPVISFT
jgi:hypothetical protein